MVITIISNNNRFVLIHLYEYMFTKVKKIPKLNSQKSKQLSFIFGQIQITIKVFGGFQ